MRALGSGEFEAAFLSNPLAMSLIPVAVAAWMIWVAQAFGVGGVSWPRMTGPRVRVFLVVVIAFWVARNLPWASVSWMAPA